MYLNVLTNCLSYLVFKGPYALDLILIVVNEKS